MTKKKENNKVELEEQPQEDIIKSSEHDNVILANTNNDFDDLEKMFQGGGESNNPSMVTKELFSIKNPKGKTDLSADQISIISRLYFMGEYAQLRAIKGIIDEFIVLRISKDRLSRKEFVESFKSMDETNKQAGMLGKFGSMFQSNK